MTTEPIVGSIRMTPTESLLLEVDLTARLDSGETLSAPAALLTDRKTGTTSTPTPAISGKKVQARVSGLTAGHTYHLMLTATGSAGNTLAEIIEIECVT